MEKKLMRKFGISAADAAVLVAANLKTTKAVKNAVASLPTGLSTAGRNAITARVNRGQGT